MNWGHDTKAVLEDTEYGELRDIDGNYLDSTVPGKKRQILMGENEVKVLIWSRMRKKETAESEKREEKQ